MHQQRDPVKSDLNFILNLIGTEAKSGNALFPSHHPPQTPPPGKPSPSSSPFLGQFFNPAAISSSAPSRSQRPVSADEILMQTAELDVHRSLETLDRVAALLKQEPPSPLDVPERDETQAAKPAYRRHGWADLFDGVFEPCDPLRMAQLQQQSLVTILRRVIPFAEQINTIAKAVEEIKQVEVKGKEVSPPNTSKVAMDGVSLHLLSDELVLALAKQQLDLCTGSRTSLEAKLLAHWRSLPHDQLNIISSSPAAAFERWQRRKPKDREAAESDRLVSNEELLACVKKFLGLRQVAIEAVCQALGLDMPVEFKGDKMWEMVAQELGHALSPSVCRKRWQSLQQQQVIGHYRQLDANK